MQRRVLHFQNRLALVENTWTMQQSIAIDSMMQTEWLEIQEAQKNPAKFRGLYNRHFKSVYDYIFRRTGEKDLAGDLCAQVFLKALENLGNYTFKGVPFSSWLFRIASNEVAQHYRNTQKMRVVSVEDTDLQTLMTEIEENHEEKEKDRLKLMETLKSLKPEDMQVILLRFFEKRSFKEVADILGITESNAKVRTYRIVQRLRQKFD